MKLIGVLCILAGSTGVGLSYARDLEFRIMELRQLQQMMILLKGQIRYVHQPLPEAFRQLSGRIPGVFSEFFAETAAALEGRTGVSAGLIWKECLEKQCQKLHLKKQEIEELQKLGNALGHLDVEMQLGILDDFQEQLKHSLAHAMEEAESRKRLYQYMGVLGGIGLTILIF